MFRNVMPRYEVLSQDAMAMLDKGWRRLMTEIGVEFMDDRASLDAILARGAARAREIAGPTLEKTYRALGLLRP